MGTSACQPSQSSQCSLIVAIFRLALSPQNPIPPPGSKVTTLLADHGTRGGRRGTQHRASKKQHKKNKKNKKHKKIKKTQITYKICWELWYVTFPLEKVWKNYGSASKKNFHLAQAKEIVGFLKSSLPALPRSELSPSQTAPPPPNSCPYPLRGGEPHSRRGAGTGGRRRGGA